MAFILRALVLFACSIATAHAWSAPSEAVVKAALVANLANYAQWQDHNWPANRTLICVAGRGPVADALQALDGQVLYGRTVSVSLRLRPADARDCQVLYLGDGVARSSAEWLMELAGSSVLTVGDGEDFPLNGGVVGLIRDGNRVGFDISLSASRRANIRFSAHLLRLAPNVLGSR